MDQQSREQVAMFRFGVIANLVNRKSLSRGEQEAIMREIGAKQWDIPGTGRSRIGRSTVLRWLNKYQNSGRKLESLQPRDRSDKGACRSLDGETAQALLSLRKEMPRSSLPVLLTIARDRKLLLPELSVSPQSLYRLFRRHGVDRTQAAAVDRRRFEVELSNDLWQSDCLHGPKVLHEGRLRQSYIFGILDDHSRLIPRAYPYLAENSDNYEDCLIQALLRRGLPRKLYVDNGAVFRCHRLKYACARLGISLLYAAPYTPEGKGKIERFFKTLRQQLFPLLPENLSLEQLAERLEKWIEEVYHQRVHSSTGQTPLQRYLDHVSLLRPAPKDLHEYFRIQVQRKVDKDRSVALLGKLYEAPVGLIGNYVTLLYHPTDPARIEVVFQDRSWGFLTLLSLGVNSRVRRYGGQSTELVPPPPGPRKDPSYRGGSLFDGRKQG
jgi:transposase InsO family protein